MVVQYKCPDCGADLSFDAASGTLKCPNCGHEEPIQNQQTSQQGSRMTEAVDHPHEDFMDESGDMVQYQCQNCGAMLITDKNTTATTCSFCGAPVILMDRLSGILKPDYVIPFRIPKEEADEAFRKWCRKLRYAPAGFRKMVKVKKVEGLYAPFWVFDMHGQGDARGEATRTRIYEEGDETVEETKHYDIYRQIDTFYDGMPADASVRLPDDLMDLMEPFDYGEMREFSAPFLTGYVAEKYDQQGSEVYPRIEKRVNQYMDDFVRGSVQGYDTFLLERRDYRLSRRRVMYCLFPIWTNLVVYEGKDYSFIMNGQTGKIAGRPPISWGKVCAYIFGVGIAVFLIIRLIIYLGGGPFLW